MKLEKLKEGEEIIKNLKNLYEHKNKLEKLSKMQINGFSIFFGEYKGSNTENLSSFGNPELQRICKQSAKIFHLQVIVDIEKEIKILETKFDNL